MLWFLRDYALTAVILRAATLAFDLLLIGGIFFCAVLVPSSLAHIGEGNCFSRRARKMLRMAAAGLIAAQVCFVGLDSAMLIGGGLRLADLYTTSYFLAGALLIAAAGAFLLLCRRVLPVHPAWLVFVIPLLGGIVWTSHSASRLEHRILLMALTGLHQLGVAVWIGGMPFLWLLLGSTPSSGADAVTRVVRRYSTAALVSVVVLVAAGISMGWFYTQSWSAIYGTAYGVVLVAKSALLLGLLLLGAGNFLLVRNHQLHLPAFFIQIARLSEAEIGIGFIIILAAASLTAQPPAVDLMQNRLTLPEIAAGMTPRWPRFTTPPIAALPPVQSMRQEIESDAMSPDDAHHADNRVEQAWSEYNHHWAGIIVLAAGLFALLGRWDRARWARHWPLVFLGLAAFLFLRADPEAWPLGPRGFWASFYNPEDLEHRLCVLLIVSFVAFEWSVQTRRIVSPKAALVFPSVCALGGALLLTHNHSLGNIKQELLTEISHTAIAICAAFAGWSRWLELRGARTRVQYAAAWVWPICLMLIGLILLNYREA